MDDNSSDDAANRSRRTIKIIPRNLTALAAYPVPGNPAISRPESGVDISYPGLEIDQRAFEQRFFPGLYFEIYRNDGVVLADVDLRPNQLVSGLSRSDISPIRPIFLLGIFCRVNPTDKEPQFFSFHCLSAGEIGPRLRDLLPGRVSIIFGPSWDIIFGHFMGAEPMELDTPLKKMEKAFNAVNDAEKFIIKRDATGQVLYGIFSDDRTVYLNAYDVIDPAVFPPGDLTKTLCAPWIHDFRDCICFYWASSKPDITDGTEPPFLNYLRDRESNVVPPPTANYHEWEQQRMSLGRMISGGWRTLPVVVNDREERRALKSDKPERELPPDPFRALNPGFDRNDIINELKYLGTVEHALIVEYLFAHYSVDAPPLLTGEQLDDEGKIRFSVASDLLEIAVEEMRHLFWVNDLLRLLGSDEPITARADVIGLRPGGRGDVFGRKVLPGFDYLDLPFSFRSLSFDVLDEFIRIEANSRSTGQGGTVFGMYVQILASLMRGNVKLPNPEQAVKTVKLLIDEGDQHGVVFQSMKTRLESVAPNFARELNQDHNGDERILSLLNLGDEYYHDMLELIHVSFGRREEVGTRLMLKAVELMRQLHEVGHTLARRNVGLRFTNPTRKFQVPRSAKKALKVLDEIEDRLMGNLDAVEKTEDEENQRLAERQKPMSRNVYSGLRRIIKENK